MKVVYFVYVDVTECTCFTVKRKKKTRNGKKCSHAATGSLNYAELTTLVPVQKQLPEKILLLFSLTTH